MVALKSKQTGRTSRSTQRESWHFKTVGSTRVSVKRVSSDVLRRMPEVKRTVAERSFLEVLLGPARKAAI